MNKTVFRVSSVLKCENCSKYGKVYLFERLNTIKVYFRKLTVSNYMTSCFLIMRSSEM